MSEKERVVGYVPTSVHRTIQNRADANDQSISEFVAEACQEKIERDGVESASQQYRIEERLLESIDDATERAADRIVEQVLENLHGNDQQHSPAEESSTSPDTDDGTQVYDWE